MNHPAERTNIHPFFEQASGPGGPPYRPPFDPPPVYRPARQGVVVFFQHACGHIEGFDAAPDHGGCDACESGSDNPADWRQLYVRER